MDILQIRQFLQIKDKLAISAEQLITAKNINDVYSPWMVYWDKDNNRRVAVSINKDLVKELKADKKIKLAIFALQLVTAKDINDVMELDIVSCYL